MADTGDLGYWLDGQLVVTGRAKDLIIVNGRNIWPQDIEWSVEVLPQLRRGDACAFAIEAEDGAESIVVVVSAWPAKEDARIALSGASSRWSRRPSASTAPSSCCRPRSACR